MPSFIAIAAAKTAAFLYGVFTLVVFSIRGTWGSLLAGRPSKRFWAIVEEERTALWTLSAPVPSLPSFSHAFLTLPSPPHRQFHFLTNNPPPQTPPSPRPLILLLHGWPDTPHLFTRALAHLPAHLLSPASSTILALSLPGFGGSDSLPCYDVNNVMNTVAEFVLTARETYNPSKVILCGHDWGGVVAARLLSDTSPEEHGTSWLADAGILANTAIPAHARRNVTSRIADAANCLAAWRRAPSSLHLLSAAAQAFRPVAAQLARSGYVFMFNLPRGAIRWFLSAGNAFFLRAVAELALSPRALAAAGSADGKEEMLGRYLAGLLGPGDEVLESVTSGGVGYSDSVKRRVRTVGWNPHSETIRLYREGLAWGEWTVKSAPLTRAAAARPQKQATVVDEKTEQTPAAFRVPVDFLWGEGDPALDERVCLSGVEKYLGGGRVRKVSKGNHWFLAREQGSAAFAEVVEEVVGRL